MKFSVLFLTIMTASSALGIDRAALLEGHRFADECDAGVDSFGASVHPLVLTNCVGCHSAAGPGPAFALPDVKASYFVLKNYVNFNDVESSRLRIRAGNSHCGPICNTQMGDTMEDAIHSWWDNGEQSCESTGRFFTGSIPVPADLPTATGAYTKLRWPLANINAGFAGHFIEIEAQKFAEPAAGMPGAYRFRAPRLVGGDKAFHVQSVRILVNRKHDILASNFTYLNAKVGPQMLPNHRAEVPYPVMSADRLIVLQDQLQGDELSVSFDVIELIDAPSCQDQLVFEEQVMPTVTARNCFGCHGGGHQRASGMSPANQTFYMGVPPAQLCAGFLQRLTVDGPQPSPAIAYPLLGVNGHPRIFVSGQEVYPYWDPWIEGEVEALTTEERY